MGRIVDACPLKEVGSKRFGVCSSCIKESHCQLLKLDEEMELQTGCEILKKKSGFIRLENLIPFFERLSIKSGNKYVYLSFSDHFENIGVTFYEGEESRWDNGK